MFTETSSSSLSLADIPEILDAFVLDHHSDESNRDMADFEATESWFFLPPPQKFPAQRANKSLDAVSKCTNRKRTYLYKERFCRAIGNMISLDEAAHWNCSDEEIQNAVSAVADLMVAQKF